MNLSILAEHRLMLPDGGMKPLGVDLLDALHHFKQPGTAGDLISLEGGRHRKADGFFGTGRIRHYQISGQRVQMAVGTLHGGIKALQVDCQIGAFLSVHYLFSPYCFG